MQEMQFRSLGREDPLEKEVTVRSSILAWEISWIQELDGLNSMRSQKVRHDDQSTTTTIVCNSFWTVLLGSPALARQIQSYGVAKRASLPGMVTNVSLRDSKERSGMIGWENEVVGAHRETGATEDSHPLSRAVLAHVCQWREASSLLPGHDAGTQSMSLLPELLRVTQ